MKQLGIIKDYTTQDYPNCVVDLQWDDPYPESFLSMIPKYEEITDSDSFEIISLFHKINNDSSCYYSYKFKFTPELETYSQQREILCDYFRGQMFYLYHDNIYFNQPIEEEAEVDVGDISISIQFIPTETTLDSFRAGDIIKSSLYKTSEYFYSKRHIFCSELKERDDMKIHQSFDVFVNGMENNFYVHFPVTDRKIYAENYWEQCKMLNKEDIQMKFRPGWYFNAVSTQLVYIDSIDVTKIPETQKFFWIDQEVSVADYYQNRYEVSFDSNQFIMIQKQRKFGRYEYNYYVPSLMHKVERIKQLHPLKESLRVIKKALKTVKHSPIAEAWGLTIDNNMLKCKAHKCEPTQLITSKGKIEAIGEWERPNEFITKQSIHQWILFTPITMVKKMNVLKDNIMQMMKTMDIDCHELKIVTPMSRQPLNKTYAEILKSKPQIIIAPFESIEKMNKFKDYFFIHGGIPTQFIDSNEVYTSEKLMNLCQAICLKTGSCRTQLSNKHSETCIIGITSQEILTNKTAITISVSKDDELNTFDTCTYVVRTEKWYSGQGMKEHIKQFLMNRSIKKLFIYRTSVSENAMKAVRLGEVEVIREVCKELFGDEIKICFITTDNISSAIGLMNEDQNEIICAPEGSFVIAPLINKNIKGFILNTMPEIGKTLKYRVLFDSTEMKFREIIQFTFDLCHLSQTKASTLKLPICVTEAKHALKKVERSELIEQLN